MSGLTSHLPAPLRERIGRMSLRTRVGLLAALGVGLAVAVVSLAAFATVRVQLLRTLDDNLLGRARAAAATAQIGDPARLVRLPAAAFVAADLRIALLRSDGLAISAEGQRSAPPLAGPELAVARGEATRSERTTSVGGVDYRVVAVPADPGFALVLGQPMTDTQRTLRRLGLVLLVVGGLGIAGAATAGAAIARSALRPVQRLTAAAEHVARTEELTPIHVAGDDEIARLARAFNAMLAALGQSRERQRRLVADAGHELRTPLTSLRTNLDLLAQSDREGGMPAADRAELIADVRAQLAELTDLVGDLVELAREDAPRSAQEPVELAELLERAVERVRRRAPGVTFDVSAQPWTLLGDPQSLERALTNLLDNAAKWSPPGGTVHVRLDGGVVAVADEGPGIAEADLPHVFDRFYRSPEARGMPGSGLGLAIVRQAATRHGGEVVAGRAPGGGALLTLRLPGAPGPQEEAGPDGSSAALGRLSGGSQPARPPWGS